MATSPATITIEPDSELGRALNDAHDAPVFIERSGKRYRVTRDQDDRWGGYDPEKFRAALRKIAGTITPEEAERLKEAIYKGREEGTRTIDRP